jgi:hypothetical protein
VSVEECLVRLYALGYHCVEMEVTATWCGVSFWRKYQRADALGAGAPTMSAALEKAVKRAESAAAQAESERLL